MRPAEQVATDLNNLRDIAGKYRDTPEDQPIKLYLLNAQLTTDLRWIKEFYELMRERPYPFKGNVHLKEVTREKLFLLNRGGMHLTSAGAEAITDPLLAKLGKKQTFEDVIRGVEVLNEAGAWYILHLKNGFGEEKKDIEETIDNIKVMTKRGIKYSRFHIASPIIYYKGTVMRKKRYKTLVYDHRFGAFRQKNILIDDWLRVKEELLKANLLDLRDPQYPLEQLAHTLTIKKKPTDN